MTVTSKALWFIESHLNGDLSLQSIADSAGVSPFHLDRTFIETDGLRIAVYTRARRLSEAAKRLASGAPGIDDVARQAGYSSPEAFGDAFRSHFGVTPESVLARGTTAGLALTEARRIDSPAPANIAPPRLEDRGTTLIFGLGHYYSGSSAGIPSQWQRFVPWMGRIAGQIGPFAYGVIGVPRESDWLYVCGVEVNAFPPEPADFTQLTLAPARYAVFRHEAHVAGVAATCRAIFDELLPAAGLDAAEAPFFERYGPEFDGRTGFGGLELWIPVNG